MVYEHFLRGRFPEGFLHVAGTGKGVAVHAKYQVRGHYAFPRHLRRLRAIHDPVRIHILHHKGQCFRHGFRIDGNRIGATCFEICTQGLGAPYGIAVRMDMCDKRNRPAASCKSVQCIYIPRINLLHIRIRSRCKFTNYIAFHKSIS